MTSKYFGSLFVNCKSCGKAFACGYYADKDSFESTEIEGWKVSCTHCGVQNAYTKADMYYFTSK